LKSWSLAQAGRPAGPWQLFRPTTTQTLQFET
jgi:hypothetical protein